LAKSVEAARASGAATGTGWPFQMGRENNCRREKRTPFARGGVVGGRAADEFEAAVQMADEAGGAEGRKSFAGHLLEPRGYINFHAASMTREVGHWWSKGKNKVRAAPANEKSVKKLKL
jgi:hypothetical protein